MSGTRYKVAISNFEAALVWGQLPGGLVQAAVRLGAGSEFGPPVQANDGSLLPSDVLGFTRNGATIFYVGNTLRARWPNPTPFSPPLPPLLLPLPFAESISELALIRFDDDEVDDRFDELSD